VLKLKLREPFSAIVEAVWHSLGVGNDGHLVELLARSDVSSVNPARAYFPNYQDYKEIVSLSSESVSVSRPLRRPFP
jgi:hypothetical protein